MTMPTPKPKKPKKLLCQVCGQNSEVADGYHLTNKHHFNLDFCSQKCLFRFVYNVDMFSNLPTAPRWQVDLRYDERQSVKRLLKKQEERIIALEKRLSP